MDAMRAAKEGGADIVKQWDSTLDRRTRPEHQSLDGQVKEVDEPFEVDGMEADAPGGFGIAHMDINCRCAVLQRARWALGRDGQTRFSGFEGDHGGTVPYQSYGDFKAELEAKWAADLAEQEAQRAALADERYAVLSTDRIKVLQTQSDSLYKDFSQEIKNTLEFYTTGGNNQVNPYLYGASNELPAVQERIKEDIASLDSAMKGFELQSDIVVFSGTKASHYAGWEERNTEAIPAFLSTSVTEKQALWFINDAKKKYPGEETLMLEIRVPRGTSGLYIGDNTKFKRPEDEFLLWRGLSYKVIDRTMDRMILEVIP